MRYVIMLITFTLSHIYCEVVKRVGSNIKEILLTFFSSFPENEKITIKIKEIETKITSK